VFDGVLVLAQLGQHGTVGDVHFVGA
jgi:hypothetical protein